MGQVMYVTGSRTLSSEHGPLMDRVISAVAGTGSAVALTCAAGAEAMLLMRASGLNCLAAVFAVGDATGAGFWAGSCPFTLLQCWGRERIRWSAGGGIDVPLPVRLLERTRACLRFVAGSGPDGRAVIFSAAPDCPDMQAACLGANAFGLSTVVFPCGFAAAELPLLAPGGEWIGAGVGVWSDAVRWSPPARPQAKPSGQSSTV